MSVSILKNKKIAIIGESTSSYYNTVPAGYPAEYPYWDVTSVDYMWWKRLLDANTATLTVNNSWRSSTIIGNDPGSLKNRLTIPNDTDICFICMGSIDIALNSPLEELKSDWENCIKTLRQNYSATRFIALLPLAQLTNDALILTSAMSDICRKYYIDVIDLKLSGIDYSSLNTYLYRGADDIGLFPTYAGQRLIADYIQLATETYNTQYTGQFTYAWLIEIDNTTGLPTGRRKLNDPSDPDYIAPVNSGICPIGPIVQNP